MKRIATYVSDTGREYSAPVMLGGDVPPSHTMPDGETLTLRMVWSDEPNPIDTRYARLLDDLFATTRTLDAEVAHLLSHPFPVRDDVSNSAAASCGAQPVGTGRTGRGVVVA